MTITMTSQMIIIIGPKTIPYQGITSHGCIGAFLNSKSRAIQTVRHPAPGREPTGDPCRYPCASLLVASHYRQSTPNSGQGYTPDNNSQNDIPRPGPPGLFISHNLRHER